MLAIAQVADISDFQMTVTERPYPDTCAARKQIRLVGEDQQVVIA
jgi:hypothetical protein